MRPLLEIILKIKMSHILLWIFCCFANWRITSIHGASIDYMKNYPAPFSSNNRVLGMVLAFNFGHIDPIILIVNEYLSMCEGGWAPKLVFFTTHKYTDTMMRYFAQKSFCYRMNASFPFEAVYHPASIGFGLGSLHRQYMAPYVDDFDVFAYHEDDIVFKFSHLTAYVTETKRLHERNPEHGLDNHIIGFQRFRRLFKGGDHRTDFQEQDVIEQEMLEEMPSMTRACIGGAPYLRIGGNIHSAIWVLVQAQVKMLQSRCQFLNQSSASREYMSSFSLYDHKKFHCGMNKLLPGERLSQFAILHYYQQRHVSWTPVFTAAENIEMGSHFTSAANKETLPDCWVPVKTQANEKRRPHPTFNATDATNSA